MKTFKYFVLLLILGLLLVACGGDTATDEPVAEPETTAVEETEETVAEEPVAEPVEEVVEEPVEEVVEEPMEEPMAEADLDGGIAILRRRLDLHDRAGPGLDQRGRDDLALLVEDLGHADLAS